MVKADTQIELVGLLRNLRAQHNETAERFGARLAEITGSKPYSPTYISLMEAGKKRISGFIASALLTLASRQVIICPAPGVRISPGAICAIPDRPCKRCGRSFIGYAAQRYCNKKCRKQKGAKKV
jgi:hypothetical protein